MADLYKSVFVYLAANISTAAVPFLLLPILTRYLIPADYGMVAMFATVLPLLGVFVGLNVHGAVTRRWYDREEINIAAYVTGCVAILLISALGVTGLFLVFGNWISGKLSIPLFWLFGAVLVSVASFFIQIRLVVWQVQEKPGRYAFLQVSSALVNAFCSIVLVVVMLKGADGRLWGHTVAFAVTGLLSLIWLRKDGLLSLKTKGSYMKDALAFGLPLVPHSVGGFLLLLADRLIVNERLGPDSVGVYMVAVQIALGLEVLNSAFNKAFVPWLFARLKLGTDGDKRRVVEVTYIYFFFLISLVVVATLLAKHVVLLLAGVEYEKAAEVLPLLVLAQAFHGMYYLVTNYLFYQRKTHITAAITLISGTFGVLLAWVLVGKLGLLGAAMASAAAMLLQFIFTWVMAQKVNPMLWFSFWAYK